MKLVIFDMDGTLVDSVAVMVESVTAAFNAHGVAVPEDKVIRSISGLNLGLGLSRLVPEADEKTIAVLEAGYRAAYLERVSKELREPLFPRVQETLHALAQRQDIMLAVATGKALRGANRVLVEHDLSALFSSVQTPDNNRSKPHPEMIYTAMADAGVVPTQTVMIGDTTHDMEMANAADAAALGVSWGFHTVDELNASGAHRTIDDYAEMIEAIDQLLGGDHA